MPLGKNPSSAQPSLLEPAFQTAPTVPAIKEAVRDWRAGKYKGATDTTRILLNYWFDTQHRLNGCAFKYYDAQREAIETVIYLYEVANVRTLKDLIEEYAGKGKDLRLLQYDLFARYGVKMATGSGKTKVMALALAWQFFKAVAEARDDYAKTFLILATNVIVFERLKFDFENGRVFRTDPLIPPELEIFWDFDFYMRGDGERASSQGALYLTNIQQFYERVAKEDDEPEIMTAVLGRKPPAQMNEVEGFDKRIAARGGMAVVINDEESEWNKVIRRLHTALTPNPAPDGSEKGVNVQLDFSATPRYSKGALFTWTVFDYPLRVHSYC